MSEPNEQERERAREIVRAWASSIGLELDMSASMDLREFVASAIAEARAEGCAKAFDGLPSEPCPDCGSFRVLHDCETELQSSPAYARGQSDMAARAAGEVKRHIDSLDESERKAADRGDKATEDYCSDQIFGLVEVRDAILALSPDPSYRATLRAEIAEKVRGLHKEMYGHELDPSLSGKLSVHDVLALIEKAGER